ncbi:tRNA-2-methylthio-N6-dimethylallyladenosine synthase [Candidatus Kryptonium thompsonii]|uniref:tRNA-2-methylthio-N(6)-dimethylallyladenosine synthase n=3 Tax=Candidatus Kryptonium thompsonii TaxID=1633631 RepID=A0A0P1MB22_9BACT|nr:tRNA (N6-isopentenyl adenosine(37)-C2)-methylthiotransferase MiaB [Candidatus Kryptonium thompsoni]CUS82724.1 tRNA-2-methylthio-N6-dimethylallyladenosine synthase [Candidatus Kryptonium thompsoni]CUS84370.1 tRNA-2-methylthio-N6-dimethylallyladenosine synthase [Candidatus Kryptonium thompsoni]CUS85461.1 tRNA-2-methylthio-N6-dimethylallyladenosine synthase [Candidatus Kryptonium thompsoni]CUS91897.1 tRNA-2-methylthio-N6-dimethylallyladenosine synthase [Candidatus Kryptonium thompsoni]CUS97683
MAETRKIYIETYGCQMNLADSEIVLGIMKNHGYTLTDDASRADVILVNTCSVREHAEQRVIGRLSSFLRYKKRNPNLVIGVLGCMAERLKKRLIEEENLADIVVGPDEYRKLPQLVNDAFAGHKGIAVRLSKVETYDDITPLRTEGISAWITVMRGCDKFCTFCVVPFTRGRERSRPLKSIVKEVEMLSARGYREVTLLGQNVNSYRDGDYDFADLLSAVAQVDRNMRVRFTTSHPKDMSDKLIKTIAEHPNICNYIHLPVQSGSDRILQLMNRTYDRKHYLELVKKIRETIPGVSLSTDIIAGFPTETEEDHKMTLSLLEEVRFDGAFMFKYSPREGTKAYEMGDDVPDEVKIRRLNEIIELQQRISHEINQGMIGSEVEVLVEGESKRSSEQWMGRTDTNKVVIFPRSDEIKPGDYIIVRINKATSATLFGDIVKILHEKNNPKNIPALSNN